MAGVRSPRASVRPRVATRLLNVSLDPIRIDSGGAPAINVYSLRLEVGRNESLIDNRWMSMLLRRQRKYVVLKFGTY